MTPPPSMSKAFSFGPQSAFELRVTARQLLRNGEPVPLGARAFDVLVSLVEARGALLTKEDLLRKVWPGLVVEEANVYVCISQLRKALGGKTIATVGGLGYRFAADVRVVGGESAPHNLPSERTAFVGRGVILEQARARLLSTRLLTFVGIGGTGKTRLALRLASSLLDEHPDGVWWVDLAPVASSPELAPAIALVVRCAPRGALLPQDALLECLRSARSLIVLDNCEHVLDGVAQLADALLGAAPHVRLLATSRESLGIEGEAVMPVRPLDVPAIGSSPGAIAKAEAVQLFIDRARRVAPSVEIGEEEIPLVADICRRLDGLPLAVELAATRMRILSLQQVLDILGERFVLLTGGTHALPRQQTLQAMIQWSYEAAGPQAQRAMRAIAVCAGGCTLDTLMALLGTTGPDIELMGGLSRLNDIGLLRVDHQRTAARYSMLDTVSHFAIDRLDGSSEASVIRDRHRDHFLELAERASAEMAGADAGAWLDRLTGEHDNLMRAIAWCDGPGRAAFALRFVAALRRYWTSRGLLSVGRELTRRALERPDAREHRRLLLSAHSSHAQLCWWLGEPAAGVVHALAAMDIATEIGDVARQSGAARVLSYLHGALGDLDAAGRHAHESLELARRQSDRFSLSDSLVAVADFHYESGELAKAEALYQEVLSIRHDLEFREGEGLAAVALAEIAIDRRGAAAARDWLRRAFALVGQTHSRYLGQHVIERAAALACLNEDWNTGLRWFAASARQRQATGLSDATTGRRQREEVIEHASRALGDEGRHAAEAGGRPLRYEETLAEVGAWLETAPTLTGS